ncbi:uncharacterized protein LOC105664026 [Megachile rotundata]|uniref:uncharacterized protein LOC105664026 n=1 Tax=Megachile rotundata TaxID=143995 RepID=UPI003FD0C28D
MHTNVRSIVVSDAESTSAPPVPPRRKKRKTTPAAIAKSPLSRETSPATGLKKSDRKRLAPPPPPPRTARRIKSRKDQTEKRVSNDSVIDNVEETLNNPGFIEADRTDLRFESADLISTKETNDAGNDMDDRNKSDYVTDSPRARPFPIYETFARKETNKYPPLFFTLHDFQNVMSSTLQHEDDSDTKSSVELETPFNNSFHGSFGNSLDDEENELCFRVTTTNLPFERCLDRWTATFADHFIEKLDESNRFIFEDYIDRSNKVNVRRSAGPMCYESFEEESSAPRLTKVRFVIESPSSSTPDLDLDDDGEVMCDSLRNIDSLVDEEVSWHHGSSVQLTEITDDVVCTEEAKNTEEVENRRGSNEFDVVPLTSILKIRSDSTSWLSLEDDSNIIELADTEPFFECEITRNDSRDSFHSSTSQDLQNEMFHPLGEEKLKIAEVSKAWLSLIKPKIECAVVLTEIKADCSNEKTQFENSSLNNINKNESNNSEAADTNKIENDVEEKPMLSKLNANVDRKVQIGEENMKVVEQMSETDEVTDLDYKLVINKTVNNIAKVDSVSNEVKTEIIEEPTEGDKQLHTINDQIDKSTKEYRRKIFVNESLRNMLNHHDFSSNESEEQNSSFEENCTIPSNNEEDSQEITTNETNKVEYNKDLQGNSVAKGRFERKESINVPVNIRRNSFLENMLTKDSNQIWTSYEIVDAHSKMSSSILDEQISESKEENKIASRLNDSINKDPEIQHILQESRASLKKIDTGFPKSTSPMMISRSNEKNPSDVKSNVLNELLSNFNNIKLKPVNIEKKIIDKTISEMTGSTQRNESEENVEQSLEVRKETSRKSFSLHDEITKETRHGITDPETEMFSPEPEDQLVSSTFEILNSKDHDNKIDQELQEKLDTCFSSSNNLASEPELEKTARFSVSPNKLSEPNLYKAKVIEIEDSSESSEITTENHVRSKESCVDKKVSIENKITGGMDIITKPPKSEKTDVIVHGHEDRDHKDEEDSNHDRGSTVQQLDLRSRRMVSGDKSAIVRRIPLPHCNNNDNNRAVTPVAVSDDQSRDTVTITPGRVRSFVRYYEIRREATTDKDSKANDRDKIDRDKIVGHQSVVSICRGLEARAVETKSLDPKKDTVLTLMEKNSEKSIGSMPTEGTCTVDMDQFSNKKSNWFDDRAEGMKADTEWKKQTDSSQESCGDLYMQSGKNKRKKSVKFQGGFTVIGPKSPDKDGSMGNSASQDTRTEKQKTPDRPTLKGAIFSGEMDLRGTEELVDDDSRIEKRDVAAQLCTELTPYYIISRQKV